ncbi:MAG: ATP-binding protein, partial [Chloroflexota bacterium]
NNVEVAFDKQGVERRLPRDAELALYRIAQEALSNVARHAKARRARLTILFGEKEIALGVSDDGVGFQTPKSPTDFAPNGHFGLLGIYERAELIGARLEIESIAGKGTNLMVTL